MFDYFIYTCIGIQGFLLIFCPFVLIQLCNFVFFNQLQTYESVEGFQVPQLTEEQGEVKEKEAEQKGENQIELTPDSK